ncbi:MAG TPA: MarR family transcriptional regulator [Candidatus Saccharimonadales bacterium]|nr:MarR family transcriptional regulator [Candidatus Saccharimonadales bacterium]
MDCEASSATGILDRLERRGFVGRQADPNDRRITTIVLTPEGVKIRDILLTSLTNSEDELLATLSEPERQQLRHLLNVILTQPGSRAS